MGHPHLEKGLIACPLCGYEVNKFGLGSHRHGDRCKARRRLNERAAQGLFPIRVRFEGLLNSAGIEVPKREIGFYVDKHGLQDRLFVPAWIQAVAELNFAEPVIVRGVDNTAINKKNRRYRLKLLKRGAKDPEFTMQLLTVLRLHGTQEAVDKLMEQDA